MFGLKDDQRVPRVNESAANFNRHKHTRKFVGRSRNIFNGRLAGVCVNVLCICRHFEGKQNKEMFSQLNA